MIQKQKWQDFENCLKSSSVVIEIVRAIEADKTKVSFEPLHMGDFSQVPVIQVVLNEKLPKDVFVNPNHFFEMERNVILRTYPYPGEVVQNPSWVILCNCGEYHKTFFSSAIHESNCKHLKMLGVDINTLHNAILSIWYSMILFPNSEAHVSHLDEVKPSRPRLLQVRGIRATLDFPHVVKHGAPSYETETIRLQYGPMQRISGDQEPRSRRSISQFKTPLEELLEYTVAKAKSSKDSHEYMVCLQSKSSISHLREVLRSPLLRSLSIEPPCSCNRRPESDLSPVSALSFLEDLHIHIQVGEDVKIPRVDSLVTLDITHKGHRQIDFSEIIHSRNLRHVFLRLDLVGPPIDLSLLSKLKKLEHLWISCKDASNHQQSSLLTLPSSKSLQTLSLSHGFCVLDLSPLAGCSNLSSVMICENPQLTSIDLTPLENLKELRLLKITDNGLTEFEFPPMQRCKRLYNLVIWGNSNDTIDLTPFAECPALNDIVLDEGVRVLLDSRYRNESNIRSESIRTEFYSRVEWK